jgi:hypothetical protein
MWVSALSGLHGEGSPFFLHPRKEQTYRYAAGTTIDTRSAIAHEVEFPQQARRQLRSDMSNERYPTGRTLTNGLQSCWNWSLTISESPVDTAIPAACGAAAINSGHIPKNAETAQCYAPRHLDRSPSGAEISPSVCGMFLRGAKEGDLSTPVEMTFREYKTPRWLYRPWCSAYNMVLEGEIWTRTIPASRHL